jgi:hypothetical protein
MDENQNAASSPADINNLDLNPLSQENAQNQASIPTNPEAQTIGETIETTPLQTQQQTPVPVENLQAEAPQAESKAGEPSVSINYVSQPSNLSENNNTSNKDKNQKTVFALALFLFITSLFGLGFYFIGAWQQGRLSRTNEFARSPEPTQVAETVASPSPLVEDEEIGWLDYTGDFFSFKYPARLSLVKEKDFVSFVLSGDEKKTVLKLKVFPRSSSRDILNVLAEESKKIDSQVTLEKVKNAVTVSQIGSRSLFSYTTEKATDPVFNIFDDPNSNQTVFILDYSKGNTDFKDLVSKVVSSFEFVAPTSIPLGATPSASPSAKFNIGE